MTLLPKKVEVHVKKNVPRRKLFLNRWLAMLAILCLTFGAARVDAMTLTELKGDAKLTPEALLKRFAEFKFKLFDGVQPREQFLSSRTGDCDDFATLAADVLREKGYHTRLIAVFMPTQVHVVCVVEETKAYLDYNNRQKPQPLVSTDGTLSDIAAKVARSFHTTWRCVSEYTFNHGAQRAVKTDFN
jgi:hypothetical protein